MCGRYTLYHPRQQIEMRFEVQESLIDWEGRYNIAPTEPVPVVNETESARLLDAYRWGLIPFWAKDPTIGNRLINARVESVAEKPAFKHAFRRKRCLMPSDGFYEWQKLDGVRQPYFIHRRDGDLFAFASLWDEWKDPNGTPVRSCTIITMPANKLVAPLHDRMPAILLKEHEDAWLDPSISDPLMLLNLITPYPDSELEAYPVSRMVNSPGNEGPDLIKPTRPAAAHPA